MTNDMCMQRCHQAGSPVSCMSWTAVTKTYSLFLATTISNKCHCSSSDQLQLALKVEENRCGYVCDGNNKQLCGGLGSTSLYLHPFPWRWTKGDISNFFVRKYKNKIHILLKALNTLYIRTVYTTYICHAYNVYRQTQKLQNKCMQRNTKIQM